MSANVYVGLAMLVVWSGVYVWDYVRKFGLPPLP